MNDRIRLFLLLNLFLSGLAFAQQPASMSVNDLNGEIGFRVHGENRTDWLGFAVSDAGDINDDGIDDFAVSALNHDGGGEDAGPSRHGAGGRVKALDDRLLAAHAAGDSGRLARLRTG